MKGRSPDAQHPQGVAGYPCPGAAHAGAAATKNRPMPSTKNSEEPLLPARPAAAARSAVTLTILQADGSLAKTGSA